MLRKTLNRMVFSQNVFISKRYLHIDASLFVKQERGDKKCMVASTATVINAKYNMRMYDLNKMDEIFQKTLKVGDSASAGYDGNNFVPALKSIGVNFKYYGCDREIFFNKVRLNEGLRHGWFMMSYKSGYIRHSCVLCMVDNHGQYHIYDPAYGCIIAYQQKWLMDNDANIEYFVPEKDEKNNVVK